MRCASGRAVDLVPEITTRVPRTSTLRSAGANPGTSARICTASGVSTTSIAGCHSPSGGALSPLCIASWNRRSSSAWKREIRNSDSKRAAIGSPLLAGLEQRFDHVHEGVDVLEAAVDRGEADVRHLVELAQPLHDEGAELLGRDL